MKRFLSCLMTLVLLLCVVGCGDTVAESQSPTNTTLAETCPIPTETIATEPIVTAPPATEPSATEPQEDVKWDVPGETYVIDISRPAETDLERMAWAIYLEGGGDAVCDDCRRRMADVILNRVECRITNMDYYWADTLIGVLSDGGINPYQNMGNKCAWPKTAHEDYERHAVERAYRIAHEVLRGQHSEIYRKGYFYYAGANVYGWEPETAINCCGIWFMRQRGWDNSKFEQDWVLSFD